MLSRVRSLCLAGAIYAGIASLYLPPGCPRRQPPGRAADAPPAGPLPAAPARRDMLATSCKSDSDCKGSESCVDGTCSLPAGKAWDAPPPHSALASWGDSLRIAR